MGLVAGRDSFDTDCMKPRSSGWRTEVRSAILREEHELRLVASAQPKPDPTVYEEASQALARATAATVEPTSLAKWWSGELVERAWANLELAGELLVLIKPEGRLRTELSYSVHIAGADPIAAQISAMQQPGTTLDRDLLRHVLVEHHLAEAANHAAARKMRNRILGAAAGLGAVMLFAIIVVGSPLREVIAIGALAGLLTAVFPLMNPPVSGGPYSLTGAQILLKFTVGAGAALAAVLLLWQGLGTLKPAMEESNAWFYAVVFGFSQQALTRLVDNAAKTVVGQASTRGAGPGGAAKPGGPAKPPSRPVGPPTQDGWPKGGSDPSTEEAPSTPTAAAGGSDGAEISEPSPVAPDDAVMASKTARRTAARTGVLTAETRLQRRTAPDRASQDLYKGREHAAARVPPGQRRATVPHAT